MDLEQLTQYALTKEATEEGFPFGEMVLVFKTRGKMFLMMALDAHPHFITLKCHPDRVLELRETYPAVVPGYHMNKKHWITILLDGSLKDNLLMELVDTSYQLVSKKNN